MTSCRLESCSCFYGVSLPKLVVVGAGVGTALQTQDVGARVLVVVGVFWIGLGVNRTYTAQTTHGKTRSETGSSMENTLKCTIQWASGGGKKGDLCLYWAPYGRSA